MGKSFYSFGRAILLAIAVIAVFAGGAVSQANSIETPDQAINAQIKRIEKDRHVIISLNRMPHLHPELDRGSVELFMMDIAGRGLYDSAGQGNICQTCLKMPSEALGSMWTEKNSKGADVTVTRFEIDPAARWGDGTSLTAQDFILGWRAKILLQGPQATPAIANIIAEAPNRLVIKFNRLVCGELPRLPRALPSKIEGPIFEANKSQADAYLAASQYTRNPFMPGLWMGPYRLSAMVKAEGQRSSSLTFLQNAAWWGRTPELKAVTLQIDTQSNAADQFQAHKLDIGLDGSPPGMATRLAIVEDLKNRMRLVFFPSPRLNHISLDNSDPILSDARVRKALWLALDREALKRSLRGTIALTADSYQHPFNPDYAPAAERIKYDPAAAAALLDETGWHVGPDGVRIDREGHRFHLNMIIGANFSSGFDQWVKEVGQRWSAIGIEFVSIYTDSRPGDAGSLGSVQVWNTYMVQDNPRNYYHSSAIPKPPLDTGGFNYSRFADAEMDQVIEEFEAAGCYPDRRRTAAQRINTLIAEKVPIIPLWFTSGSYLLPKSLDVGTISGVDDRITARIEHWRLTGARQ